MIRLREKVGTFFLVVVLGLSMSGWSGSFLGAWAYQGDIPDIVIRDNNKDLTFDCNGAAVIVNGNHNRITLLGACSSLTVRGNTNLISLEEPTVVIDTGNNNVIMILQSAPPATPAPTATPQSPTDTPQSPTDIPPSPTNTPQAPTDTPQSPINTPGVPTDTPQDPTHTPQSPTDTPQAPTGTPESPTDTPQTPTGTPLPATETPAVDTEAPTVRWIAPVSAGERYTVREGEQVLLEAEVSDNVGVAVVRFLWWDAVNELYITLGTLTHPPFHLQINTSSLNSEWNQIFALASDQVQNSSDYSHIWIYKLVLPESQSGYQIFLPVTGK